MYVAVLQLRDTLASGNLYLFTAFVVLTWLLWAWKAVLSARYRPWTTPHSATVTIVVPVVDEPLDLFKEDFGSTIERLREVTEDGKPILLAEIGADADDAGKKTDWIESLFVGLADPEYDDVIGFVWFNMDKSDPDSSDPDDVHADWRIEQSPESAAAFRDGVTTGPNAGRYGAGHPIE